MNFNFNRTIMAAFTALSAACTTVPSSPATDKDINDSANKFLNSIAKDVGPACRYIPDPNDSYEKISKECLPRRDFPN